MQYEDPTELTDEQLRKKMVEIAQRIEKTDDPMKLYELYYSEYDWRHDQKRYWAMVTATIASAIAAIASVLGAWR
jgi:hypothetical protein